MDARDHSVLIFPTRRICGLEWIVWAMDAARQYNETKEQETPFDICTYYSSEQLSVL